MLPRRQQIDPETARAIEQRLSALLDDPAPPSWRSAEPPRRAAREQLDDVEPKGPALRPDQDWLARLCALLLSRAHLGVVAVLAVLSLLFAGWLVLRARPVAIATPLSTTTAGPAATPTTAPPTPSLGTARASPTPEPDLVVHVLGAVRRPGLVDLRRGSRVQDALQAAGGLRRDADPDRLNLAAPVADGEQIFVGTRAEPGGEVRQGSGGAAGGNTDGTSGSSAQSVQTVDLNAASAAQLEELPGVGPVTASKIIAWRAEHGRFSRVEELREVSGIGPKTYAEIAPHCRV